MDFDQPDDTSRLLPIENQEKGGGSCHHKTTDPHEKKNTIHTHPDADVVVGQQQDDPRLICVWYFLCHYVYSRAKEKKKTNNRLNSPSLAVVSDGFWKNKKWTSSTTATHSVLLLSVLCSIRRRRGNKRENHVNRFDCWLPVRANHTHPNTWCIWCVVSTSTQTGTTGRFSIFCIFCVPICLSIGGRAIWVSTIYSHPSTFLFFLKIYIQFKWNQR